MMQGRSLKASEMPQSHRAEPITIGGFMEAGLPLQNPAVETLVFACGTIYFSPHYLVFFSTSHRGFDYAGP